MIRSGFVYLSNNRKKAGLFFDMPTSDNMACPVLEDISGGKILKRKKISEYTRKYIDKFNIIIPDVKTKPKNLSGGNQQKLMFSVCLGTSPQCVILNEPTRGIDVGAKAEIHKFILELPKNNTSVILFSSEIPELISLCDRIIILRNHKVVKELSGEEIDEEKMLTVAAGG
jgi:ABC-type sugar transport system ATPase subunit